jgi:hypothetical protein
MEISSNSLRIPQFAVEFTARRWLCVAAGHFSSYRDASGTDWSGATLHVTNFLPSRRPAKEEFGLSGTVITVPSRCANGRRVHRNPTCRVNARQRKWGEIPGNSD